MSTNDLKPEDLSFILAETFDKDPESMETLHSVMIANTKLLLERLERIETVDLFNGSGKQKKILNFLDYFSECADMLRNYIYYE